MRVPYGRDVPVASRPFYFGRRDDRCRTNAVVRNADGLSETDLECRRSAYNQIRTICQDRTLTDREKLDKCINVSRVYYCLTGDDSLTPEKIRQVDAMMIEQASKKLEQMKKVHDARERDAKTGQDFLFGIE